MTPGAGDYFVVATQGWGARAIRAFTGSWANHAGLFVGVDRIVEASGKGVIVRHVREYASHHIAWSALALSKDERQEIVGAALGMVGIPYNYLDIAAMVAQRFRGPLGDAAEERLNRGDRLICSQLVARAYRTVGIDLVPGKPDNFVTPADLAARLT